MTFSIVLFNELANNVLNNCQMMIKYLPEVKVCGFILCHKSLLFMALPSFSTSSSSLWLAKPKVCANSYAEPAISDAFAKMLGGTTTIPLMDCVSLKPVSSIRFASEVKAIAMFNIRFVAIEQNLYKCIKIMFFELPQS